LIYLFFNVFLIEGDFDVSRIIKESDLSLSVNVGTELINYLFLFIYLFVYLFLCLFRKYRPKEMSEDKRYSFSADLFCLGCVIYEMMTLRYPFAGTSDDPNLFKLFEVIIIIIIIVIIIIII
jgi:serine/threonine protein kinase